VTQTLDATRLPTIEAPTQGTLDPDGLTTLNAPYDPTDTDWQRWLPGQNTSSGNEVIAYIDGLNTFNDMVAAIRATTGPAHFIYLAAWNTEDFPLVPGEPHSSLSELLAQASARGVAVRALIYQQNQLFGARDNSEIVDMINGLATGAAIHDGRVLLRNGFAVGAHHQKMLIVHGPAGLVAFQGGIDLDRNRLPPALHDVHTRVMGPAAHWLYRTFVERWHDHPEAVSLAPVNATLPAPKRHPSVDHFTHVARTYGSSAKHGVSPAGSPPYAFAPQGERSIKSLVLKAIQASERFIYLEDQYLVDMDISRALVAALPKLKKLIILVCDSGAVVGEIFQVGRRRKAFLDPLLAAGPGKVHVCTSARYIHAKVWIFDDRFAVIGSANVNRRGFTHDSEQAIGVFDVNARRRWFFAHELRMHLWSRHLGLPPRDTIDAVTASRHWASGQTRGEIQPFVADPAGDKAPDWKTNLALAAIGADLWDDGIDPDGS